MKIQKLKSLISFLLVNVAIVTDSSAQIAYTDLIPDKVLSNTSTTIKKDSIDINNDGVYDFNFKAYKVDSVHPNYFYNCYITSRGSNEIISSNTNSIYALNLNSGLLVQSGSQWSSDNLLLSYKKYTWHYHYQCKTCWNYYYTTTTYGNWNDTSVYQYVGVKIKNQGQTYYGWIQLSASPYIIKIKDYAINSVPNQPILAGESSCTTPTATLNASGPLSFCAGDSVTLEANGTGYQYQWKKDGVNISGATSQTYIVKTAGVYKCKVTNSCGSKASGTKTVTVPCRNADASLVSMTNRELEHLSVHPNPATNYVTIKFPSHIDENAETAEVQIVNLFGQIVFSEKIFSDEMKIDVSKFSEGMYVIRLSSGGNNETKTFSLIK